MADPEVAEVENHQEAHIIRSTLRTRRDITPTVDHMAFYTSITYQRITTTQSDITLHNTQRSTITGTGTISTLESMVTTKILQIKERQTKAHTFLFGNFFCFVLVSCYLLPY